MNNKEVAIIGGGPSGVTSAIYLKRYGMEPVLFEKDLIGGKTNYTERIENYPGYLEEKGPVLAERFLDQLRKLQIKPIYSAVESLSLNPDGTFHLVSKKKEGDYRYVILANGLSERPFPLEGEEKFNRRGISRCAICDGPFYKGKDVLVIGSGNAAFEEANYLATICSSVSLIARRTFFRADRAAIDRFRSFSNTAIYAPYEVVSVFGKESLEKAVIRNKESGERKELPCSGLFLYVGQIPALDYLKIDGVQDEKGYLIVNPETMETKASHLYAVGDCRETALRQVTTAVSDGSLAATKIHEDFLSSNKE